MTVSLLILLAVVTQSTTLTVEDPVIQVLSGSKQFTNKMYMSLIKKHENIVFSPFSAHACLSMLYQGTAGHTQEEFANTLGVADPHTAAEGYNSIITDLNRVEDVTVAVSNKVYVMTGKHFEPDFENIVTAKFLSEVGTLNFAESQLAAEEINSWVQNKTEQKIEKLFELDAFSFQTAAVLVNVIYFEGNWARKFKRGLTKMKPFYTDDVNTVDVLMMYYKHFFYYKEDEKLDSQILKLEYENKNFSMIVILPNATNGITELEDKLSDYDLNKLGEGFQSNGVRVSLPKFKISVDIDLKQTLADMGHVFSTNFSKITEKDDQLTIDEALQKAYIEVNEDGTKAGAATGISKSWRSGLRSNHWYDFVADHPFVYMITSTQTNGEVILFYGSVRNPISADL